jgi:hypothetical protein
MSKHKGCDGKSKPKPGAESIKDWSVSNFLKHGPRHLLGERDPAAAAAAAKKNFNVFLKLGEASMTPYNMSEAPPPMINVSKSMLMTVMKSTKKIVDYFRLLPKNRWYAKCQRPCHQPTPFHEQLCVDFSCARLTRLSPNENIELDLVMVLDGRTSS